jgi:hypothetical protein
MRCEQLRTWQVYASISCIIMSQAMGSVGDFFHTMTLDPISSTRQHYHSGLDRTPVVSGLLHLLGSIKVL